MVSKKLFSITFALSAVLFLSGCGGSLEQKEISSVLDNAELTNEEKIEQVARAIWGDTIDESQTKFGVDTTQILALIGTSDGQYILSSPIDFESVVIDDTARKVATFLRSTSALGVTQVRAGTMLRMNNGGLGTSPVLVYAVKAETALMDTTDPTADITQADVDQIKTVWLEEYNGLDFIELQAQ